MPPVRWKSLCITLLILHQEWVITNAQEMQDAISMTSDGWRPIVGTGRQPPTYSETRIAQYKSPSQKVEFDIVKSENTIAISSTGSPQKFGETSTSTINHVNGGMVHSSFQGGKVPQHTKFPSYHTLPPPPHRSSIQGRPGQVGFRRQPQKQEPPHAKRKPARGQAVAHSNREEVYVHAPINIPYLKLGPSNVKPRETQGLGFHGKNRFTGKHHFTINQPNSHVEINRFPHPPTNDEVFEQFKSQTLLFPKLKNQQDEYTRNLVPPPALRHLAEKEKLKSGKIPAHFKDNVATVSEPVIEFHDVGLQGFLQPQPPVQENLVQVSEPYGQALEAFRQRYRPEEPAIDVQVTKEKVKEWQNTLPNRVNPKVPQYVDYDFHSLTNQGQLPKLQTYEVTEGKWSDNPDPYTFVYHQQPQQSQQLRQPSSLSSARPQLIAEPSVELHVPPFLPTPYRPPGPFPTSSTHSEASTVFSKVSEKMNKYKEQALADNPLFFDIKEVSTHYPILGQPAFTQESQTDTSLPMSELGDISNDITTQRPKLRRRRPQPRKQTTTTTLSPPPTTTEEAEATESYDFQKLQEPLEASQSAETERPRRKKRPRVPSRTRYDGSTSVENEERPSRYRTMAPTTEVDDSDEKKNARSRHRYRQRGNKDSIEMRNVHLRKRTRPPTTTTEMPANHKTSDENFSSSMSEENSREPIRVSQEVFQNRYRQEFDEESATGSYERERQPVSVRYKLRDDVVVETTSVADGNDEVGVVIEEVTDRAKLVEKTEDDRSTTTEATIVNINPPENEIDFPASSSPPSQSDDETDAQTTLATTTTTTTTAASVEEPLTSRPGGKTRHRLPIKYNANRPRFSVKEYRQRLSQYTSTTTTPSTTTDFVRTTSERLRFPNRLRSRPTHPTHSTTHATAPTIQTEDEPATEPVLRRKFVPKDPRHGYPGATTESNVIGEKPVKAVNIRMRPFGGNRASGNMRGVTASGNSVTASGSSVTASGGPVTASGGEINGALYSRKRPAGTSSLRSKYFGRPEKNMTSVGNVAKSTTEKEDVPVAVDEENHVDSTTTEPTQPTTEDLLQDDYSQRVSDLTSSFKTQYETPGLFNSVSPNSRRVPNYFTISTDDPILPIEAFFPNIKDKERER